MWTTRWQLSLHSLGTFSVNQWDIGELKIHVHYSNKLLYMYLPVKMFLSTVSMNLQFSRQLFMFVMSWSTFAWTHLDIQHFVETKTKTTWKSHVLCKLSYMYICAFISSLFWSLRKPSRHSVLYGVESWSGVLEWNFGG